MIKDRVEYFESNDLLFGHNLGKIESMLIPELSKININDAIEYFEIKRYFEKETSLKKWSESDYETYKNKSDKLYRLCSCYINSLNNGNIIDEYSKIDSSYISQFWTLFDIFKLYKVISEEVFANLIKTHPVSPFDFFKHKDVVCKYGGLLRDYILNNDCGIIIVLHVSEQDNKKCEKLHLPKELSGDDICYYLSAYIKSDDPNINRLNKIKHMQKTKQFPVSDEIRLSAKRRYDIEIEKISDRGRSLKYGVNMALSSTQSDLISYFDKEGVQYISYSKDWFLNTLEYLNILKNFIHTFGYVDIPQMRCLHVYKEYESGIFERSMKSDSSRVYPINHNFHIKNAMASLQMSMYYTFLLELKIQLEDVLKWFYTEYLQTNFCCPEIRVNFPSVNSTYSEKCSSIITSFETILKQFVLFERHKEIDFELVAMSTDPMRFEDVKSLIKDKYIYGSGKDYDYITHLLFSDQCTFTYVQRLQNKEYNNFYDLITNEDIYTNDYRQNELVSFTYLQDNDLINIDTNGLITVKNKLKVVIFNDLYLNNVISIKHYPIDAVPVFDEFVQKGYCIIKDTLLSTPEANYFNYLLNRSEYCNGLEIRNTYIHGIQQVNMNEDEHKQNYFMLLRIFIILTIKIYDEFFLYTSEEQSDQETST